MPIDKYFFIISEDNPGHVEKKFFLTAFEQVEITGEKHDAYKYFANLVLVLKIEKGKIDLWTPTCQMICKRC